MQLGQSPCDCNHILDAVKGAGMRPCMDLNNLNKDRKRSDLLGWQLMGSTAASPQLNLRLARLGNSFLPSIMSSDEEDYMSMVIEEPKQKETFTQRKQREQREVNSARLFSFFFVSLTARVSGRSSWKSTLQS